MSAFSEGGLTKKKHGGFGFRKLSRIRGCQQRFG